MKACAAILFVGVFMVASLSGNTLEPKSRRKIEQLIAQSEVIAVVSVSFGPEKTRLEISDVVLSERGTAQKGAVVEVEREKPNDGAHPAFPALVFFPHFPPKATEFIGLLLVGDKIENGPITVSDVKEWAAKKKANQSSQRNAMAWPISEFESHSSRG